MTWIIISLCFSTWDLKSLRKADKKDSLSCFMKSRELYLPFLVLVWMLTGIFNRSQAQITIGNSAVDTQTIISGIDIPWEIIWGPDDQLWMTERYGRVSRVDPATGQQSVLLTLPDCHATGESGLLGMALYPNFADTAWVFFAYTYLQGGQIRERLVRYTYDSSAQALVSPLTLINDIPGNSTHNGARLLFLPDNSLLMTTGDAQNQAASLNPAALTGKVLRLWADGSIPVDNPTPGSYVYTIGHRNAQGMILHPNGKVYISEHGPSSDDELNIISANRNYGWPSVNGLCDSPAEIQYCNANDVFEPLQTWTPTIAPSDMLWYTSATIPAFQNRILLTTLKNQRLYALELDAAGDNVIGETQYLNGVFGRLRDICTDPAGNIYLATNGTSWSNNQPFSHRIVKLGNAAVGTRVRDLSIIPAFRVYPNPLQANSRMVFPPQLIGQQGSIYDLQGRRLHLFDITETEMRMPALPDSTHVFLLRVSGSRQVLRLLRL